MITQCEALNLAILNQINKKNQEFIQEANYWWDRFNHNCNYLDYIRAYLDIRWCQVSLCN